MIPPISEPAMREIVARALAEDLGPGDVTTLATVDPEACARAAIIAKAEGVVAGLGVARAVFLALDANVVFEAALSDGDRVTPGVAVARIAGRAQAILTGERAALNFLQRMSGIATLTSRFVAAVAGTRARICDTRKTAPGLRLLDKHAVRAGGGVNHRAGLFDGVLIKDNHIRAAGGIAEAVKRARAGSHHLLKIEVEVATPEDVGEALRAGADVLLLDNMDVSAAEEATREAHRHRCTVEISGGVSLENVRAYAECGADYISVGALTHSAPALDLSLEIVEE